MKKSLTTKEEYEGENRKFKSCLRTRHIQSPPRGVSWLTLTIENFWVRKDNHAPKSAISSWVNYARDKHSPPIQRYALRCIVCYAKIKEERMTCVKLRIGVPTKVERSFTATFKGLSVRTAPILRLRGTRFCVR